MVVEKEAGEATMDGENEYGKPMYIIIRLKPDNSCHLPLLTTRALGVPS